ncbi:MAG: protein translocase subunit SecF [Elusimicrobia bacterium]|nr:protein translocase subunit SecF [Elusimicrobiota bacterium]
MMVLIPKTNIDFIGKRFVLFAISGFFIALGIVAIAVKGINFGLDFTGGTLVQVQYDSPVVIGDVRGALQKAGITAGIQSFTGRNSFAIRVKGRQENVNEVGNKITGALKAAMPDKSFKEERREYVGPTVGRDLARRAVMALVFSMFGIIVYVAFRFSNPIWGTMGVLALFHDVFITLGFMTLTGREIDLVIVAALLTIAGYSINDTIVIFDRMRENMRLHVKMPLGELVNKSINETLSRTLITNFTVLSAVAVLYFAGGDVINDFAFAMLVGSIFGTYSTIAIATPLVYQWETRGKPVRK